MARVQNTKSALLVRSIDLLMQAREFLFAGDLSLAVEYAYRAALRCAGARVADSPVAKRKRKPSNAWEQLAMIDELGKQRAMQFQAFSRIRQRVVAGLRTDIDEAKVRTLIDAVDEFISEVQYEGTSLAA
ncbi:MAG: SAV_6107 family HEPN domain-containing protein [Corynebacterium sp.]|nr:SAV_6107 family HEPN domain-containing protein [Corynebacterium sp.]